MTKKGHQKCGENGNLCPKNRHSEISVRENLFRPHPKLGARSPTLYVEELVCHCGHVVRSHQKISIVCTLRQAVESRAQVKIGGCDDVRWRTNDRTLYDGSVYYCY